MTRSKYPKTPCANDEERKERRRAANRRSAQKSRYREMVLMDELQKTVTELTRRNAMLREQNKAYKNDIAMLKQMMEMQKLRRPVINHSKAAIASSIGLSPLANTVAMTTYPTALPRTPSPIQSKLLIESERMPIDMQLSCQTGDKTSLLSAQSLYRALAANMPANNLFP